MKTDLHSKPGERERLIDSDQRIQLRRLPGSNQSRLPLSPRRGEFTKQIAKTVAKRVDPAFLTVAPLGVRKANGSAGCRQHFT